MFEDPRFRLRCIIALHSTRLGPAAGGCRFWPYASTDGAIGDALRLSRGMSYKNAMAGLPLGGGKSVIMRPEGPFDRVALFRAFGDAVQSFGGRYLTAEDVGTSIADMEAAHSRTRYVAGLSARPGPGRRRSVALDRDGRVSVPAAHRTAPFGAQSGRRVGCHSGRRTCRGLGLRVCCAAKACAW